MSNNASWKSVRVTPNSPHAGQSPPPRSPFSPTAALVVGTRSMPTSPATVATSTSGAQSTQSLRIQDMSLQRLRVLSEKDAHPTPVRISNNLAPRDFSQPAHRYDFAAGPPRSASSFAHAVPVGVPIARAPGSVAGSKTSRVVDSRAGAKPSQSFADSLSVDSLSSQKREAPPPQYFGSTFTHLPNSKRLYIPTELPANPTLPKTFPSLVPTDFQHSDGLMSNRTADGKILGAPSKRFVSEAHVPYFDQTEYLSSAEYTVTQEPVGPNNPHQPMNDTWTKCWDDEAGAVYYYNNVTGEATWICPEL